jgi:hypothetical protein
LISGASGLVMVPISVDWLLLSRDVLLICTVSTEISEISIAIEQIHAV